jgi:heme/copper-type cytochrome/quinol oxidase subunit 3
MFFGSLFGAYFTIRATASQWPAHGLHGLGGLVAMTIMGAPGRRGDVHGGRYGPAEAVSYYWHFVDVVWILLFLTLYLLD